MNLDLWIEKLKGGMCISEMDLKRLCYYIKNLLIEESNVQHVRAPVTVSISGSPGVERPRPA